MWGTATSNEMAPAQAVANPNTHFPEDAATLLDFPDWDGPGTTLVLHGATCTTVVFAIRLGQSV